MGQLVSMLSYLLCKKRDRPLTSLECEPNPKRRAVDPNVPSTSKVECQDIRVVKESVSRKSERKRWEVAWFLYGGVVVIPITEGGVSYVDEWGQDQFQKDHRYEMYY